MSQNTNKTKITPRCSAPLWVQILVWIGLLALLGVLGVSLIRSRQSIIVVGSQVPDFTLPLYEGYEYNQSSEVRLSDLHGKIVIINFWASWCKPCESEAADLEQAWRYYQPTGNVVFLGVDYVDTEPEARSYLAKFDITFPNGPDMRTAISRLFNRNLGVPETYVIDQKGVLRFIMIGPFSSLSAIRTVVDPLIAGD